MARLWIRGFELPITQEEGQTNPAKHIHPGYSRQPQPRSLAVSLAHAPAQGGCGFAAIDLSNINTQLFSTNFDTGTARGFFMESFWIYVNRLPTAESQWFGSSWVDPASQTLWMSVDGSATVRLYNRSSGALYPGTLLGNLGTIPVKQWMMVLVRYIYQTPLQGGTNQYINVQIVYPDYRFAVSGPPTLLTTYAGGGDFLFHSTAGMATPATHNGSRFGEDQSQPASGLEMFYDDWSADDAFDTVTTFSRPNGGDGGLYYHGLVLPLLPQTAGFYNQWTLNDAGAIEAAYPRRTDVLSTLSPFMTSPVTPTVRQSFACGTCISQQIAASGDTIGAILVTVRSNSPTHVSPFLRVNGVDQSFASRIFTFSNSSVMLLRRSDLVIAPTDSLEIGAVTDASGTSVNAFGVGAEVQVLNTDYPSAAQLSASDSSIQVAFGRYTGTGTRKVLTPGFGTRFLSILRTTPGVGGAHWWDQRIGASSHGAFATESTRVPAVSATTVVINSSTDSNASGSVYAYVAVSDPQSRGFQSGVVPSHVSSDVGRAGNLNRIPIPRVGSNFVPSCQMLRQDWMLTNTGGWYLFVNGAANSALLTGGTVGSALQSLTGLAAGTFLTGTPLQGATNVDYWGMPFAFWRSDQFVTNTLWNTARWTGDGTASQVVTVPLSSLVPGWIVAVGDNTDGGVIWIVGMVAPASQLISGSSNTNTGVTAVGVNQFTAGAFLNKAGVNYMAFAIANGTGTVPVLDGSVITTTDAGPFVPAGTGCG